MKYDFDKAVNRYNTNSVKYDFVVENGYPPDVLPMWVADMDFPVCEHIQSALKDDINLGLLGYSDCKSDYYESVSSWFERRFNWHPEEGWLIKTPGVVFALTLTVKAFTNEGESVLIQPPVYYPFFTVVKENKRKLVENPLVYSDSKYTIDFDDMEKKIIDNNVKLFLFCSPHNPVGRVWTDDELREVSRICKKHEVIIASDEIHCDFTMTDRKHHILLEACPELAEQSVILTAPSKTFNLAGMQTSNIWIPNPSMRRKFRRAMDAAGCFGVGRLGVIAAKAAYNECEDWFEQCKEYIKGNIEYAKGFVRDNLPQIRYIDSDGTYFAWLDCSGMNMSQKELHDFFVQKARLWLDDGAVFGTGGEQFERIVLACPRSTIEDCMNRIKKAFE